MKSIISLIKDKDVNYLRDNLMVPSLLSYEEIIDFCHRIGDKMIYASGKEE